MADNVAMNNAAVVAIKGVLAQYDLRKGVRRKVLGDSDEIKHIRTLINGLIDGEKELREDTLAALELICKESQRKSGATYDAIKMVESVLQSIRAAAKDKKDILEMDKRLDKITKEVREEQERARLERDAKVDVFKEPFNMTSKEAHAKYPHNPYAVYATIEELRLSEQTQRNLASLYKESIHQQVRFYNILQDSIRRNLEDASEGLLRESVRSKSVLFSAKPQSTLLTEAMLKTRELSKRASIPWDIDIDALPLHLIESRLSFLKSDPRRKTNYELLEELDRLLEMLSSQDKQQEQQKTISRIVEAKRLTVSVIDAIEAPLFDVFKELFNGTLDRIHQKVFRELNSNERSDRIPKMNELKAKIDSLFKSFSEKLHSVDDIKEDQSHLGYIINNLKSFPESEAFKPYPVISNIIYSVIPAMEELSKSTEHFIEFMNEGKKEEHVKKDKFKSER